VKIPFKFETIDDYGSALRGGWTERAKVIGGWVLTNTYVRFGNGEGRSDAIGMSSVFISDPEHKWEVK
jgi:hypothetical protein